MWVSKEKLLVSTRSRTFTKEAIVKCFAIYASTVIFKKIAVYV
jgi:hypothetical protein